MVNVSFRNQQVCEEVDRAPHLRKVASANLQWPIPTCRIELLQPRCAFNNSRVKNDRLHPAQFWSFTLMQIYVCFAPQLSPFPRLTLVPGSCHCLNSMQSHHNGKSILYNSIRYLRASINDGTTFATRRSTAPSTSPVVGAFSIMEMSAPGWF
jgi:hypothetical protein